MCAISGFTLARLGVMELGVPSVKDSKGVVRACAPRRSFAFLLSLLDSIRRYGASDGFVNQRLTPKLTDVSCANCHGRGDYHVRFHRGEPNIPERAARLTSNDCTVCHDEENSVNFELSTYWELIKHGRE